MRKDSVVILLVDFFPLSFYLRFDEIHYVSLINTSKVLIDVFKGKNAFYLMIN